MKPDFAVVPLTAKPLKSAAATSAIVQKKIILIMREREMRTYSVVLVMRVIFYFTFQFRFQVHVPTPHRFQVLDGWDPVGVCGGSRDTWPPDRGHLQAGLSLETAGHRGERRDGKLASIQQKTSVQYSASSRR